MTTTQPTLEANSIQSGLTVNDLEASIRFYEGLGFGIEERWEQDGKLAGVLLKAGKGRLMLGQDDWAKGRDRVKGVGHRLWISTDQDVDELAAKAKAAGVKLDGEPENLPWGARGFAATDPDGFKVMISREV